MDSQTRGGREGRSPKLEVDTGPVCPFAPDYRLLVEDSTDSPPGCGVGLTVLRRSGPRVLYRCQRLKVSPVHRDPSVAETDLGAGKSVSFTTRRVFWYWLPSPVGHGGGSPQVWDGERTVPWRRVRLWRRQWLYEIRDGPRRHQSLGKILPV